MNQYSLLEIIPDFFFGNIHITDIKHIGDSINLKQRVLVQEGYGFKKFTNIPVVIFRKNSV